MVQFSTTPQSLFIHTTKARMTETFTKCIMNMNCYIILYTHNDAEYNINCSWSFGTLHWLHWFRYWLYL